MPKHSKGKKIKIDPSKTLNNPEREIDMVIVFPVERRNDVGEDVLPNRAEHVESRLQRLDVVKKFHAAGLELTESITQDGAQYLFRVSAPTKLLRRIAEQMGPRFKTKLVSTQEETQKGLWPGFAPYLDENRSKYEISITGFFKPIDRQIIIRYMMETALGGDGFHDRKIEKMEADGICQVCPTHSADDQEDLIAMWASFGRKMLITWQPLDKIRDYFGEEIAIYFAFLGFYTLSLVPLGLFGIITYYFQSQNVHHDTVHAFVYAAVCCGWAVVFTNLWKREQRQLQVKWDVEEFEEEQSDRLEFTGQIQLSTITMEKETVFEDWERNRRYALTGSVMFICVAVVIFVMLTVILLKNELLKQMGAPGATIGGVVNSMAVILLNLIYIQIAHTMNDYENHQTQTQYEDMLIMKLFLFQFANTFFTIFFMAFAATRLNLMGEEVKCHLSCLEEVQALTQSLLITNLVIGNVTETLVPFALFKLHQRALEEENKNVEVYHSKHEIEAALEIYQGSFEEYNEIVLQFTIVTVCALAYPLGGLIALLNI